uniref:Bidirectional sugar transporter SWEET n=1 Tax=Kalanchoe fedtschenkoi TaxID=63787 RepID=A0A7N0U2P1_KALFE
MVQLLRSQFAIVLVALPVHLLAQLPQISKKRSEAKTNLLKERKKKLKMSEEASGQASIVGPKRRSDAGNVISFGAFCVAFGILMYASPLTVMYKVCRDKSVEYMPFWLSFTGFANGIVWVAYALLQFDLNILSNGTGAVLGAIQLLLWTYYRAMYPKCCAGDARQTDIEIMAATKVQDQV